MKKWKKKIPPKANAPRVQKFKAKKILAKNKSLARVALRRVVKIVKRKVRVRASQIKASKRTAPPENLPWFSNAFYPPQFSLEPVKIEPITLAEPIVEEQILETNEEAVLPILETEDQEVELKVKVGAHPSSAHVLKLGSVVPEIVDRQENDIKLFFEQSHYNKRPSVFKRMAARLLGVFGSEREVRVLAPTRPRLVENILDELLLINLAEIAVTAIRWAFSLYFSVLVRLADSIFWFAGKFAREEKEARTAFTPMLLPKTVARPSRTLKAPVRRGALQRLPFLHFSPPPRSERAIASFILLAFVFILPLRIVSTYSEVKRTKSVILQKSVRAFEALGNSWSQVGNLESASAAFEEASRGFDSVLKDVEETHRVLQKVASLLPEGDQLEAGKALLLAGSLTSASAQVLSGRLANLNDKALPPSDRVHQLGESLRTALPLLLQAREKLDTISLSIIPGEFRGEAVAAMSLLDNVIRGVENSESATGALEYILGRIEPRRYLIVFQNNTELRPSGGFIGSFAELDMREGEVTRLWMPGGGSYDLQGTLRATLMPPEPLGLIAERWEFQDANWFPDFPTTAKKLMWFYEKSGGPTVDGVIALTTSVVEKLLAVTGPIEMPEYGKIITADNFWIETQKAVELEYDREENKPKQFLADLAPKLIEKLKSHDPKIFFALAKALNETIGEKHFQIYLRDKLVQEVVTHLGWAGELKSNSGDFLTVVNTNIAGGKTDTSIREHINHLAEVDENGRVKVTLQVTRTHEGVKGELFRGVRNVDYVRVYVPEGATLLSAEGFRRPDPSLWSTPLENALPDSDLAALEVSAIEEPSSRTLVSHEFGRTVFGNWIMVDPGESVTYKLIYELPFRVTFKETEKDWLEKIGLREESEPQASYSLLVSKQAGTTRTTLEHRVLLPPSWNSIWKYPDMENAPNHLNRDSFFGIVATQ